MSTHEGENAGFITGLALLIPITLATMAIVLLAPILPQLQKEFAATPHADYLIPIVLTMPALCVAILSPFAGALGDYFGRRRLLILALGMYGIVGVAPVFLTGLPEILASRVAVGVAEALIMTLSTAMIGDHFHGAARDRWLAAQTAIASLSALVFFNAGGLLGTMGWRAPFWAYGSALIMLVGILQFTHEPSAESKAHSRAHGGSWAGFPWLTMAGICAVTVFASIMFYTMQIQSAPGLVSHGITNPAQIGFLTSLASIGVPVGTVVYSRLSKTPVGGLLLAEFLVLGVGFVLMSNAPTATLFLVGCAINQLGAGMVLPTLLVWAMSQLAYEVRGRGTGIWQSMFAFGQFLSPIAVTFIASRTGGLLPAFAWLGYAALAAAAFAGAGLLRSRGAPVVKA